MPCPSRLACPPSAKSQPFPTCSSSHTARILAPEQGALRLLHPALTAERAILAGLAREGSTAFRAALAGVPRTLRMMYVHAYQSYLWNAAASHRVATYGLQGWVRPPRSPPLLAA